VPVLVLGAFFQQERGVFRAAGHEASGEGAHVDAVAGEADAAGHQLDIGHLQAGGAAALAGHNTGVEGVELALGVRGHGVWGCGEEA